MSAPPKPAGGRSNPRPSSVARRRAPTAAAVFVGMLALCVALGSKLGYAQATATDLLWVLAPSCRVAQWLGGLRFVWDPESGFVSDGARLVVGPPCAGVNFFVACSLALYFSCQGASANVRGKLSLCAASFATGYLATIAANGSRIALAAHLRHAGLFAGIASDAAVHRWIGVVVYASALLAVCAGASRLLASRGRAGSGRMTRIPLACYVGIALALPICHAALGHRIPRLAEHVAQTALALGVVMVLARVGDHLLDRVSSRSARTSPRS